MDKKWPFGFFVYSNVNNKEETAQAAPETVEEPAVEEVVKVVWAETPASVMAEDAYLPDDEPQPEDAEPFDDDDDDFVNDNNVEEYDEDEDDEDLPELEEGLEIALEEAHRKGLKKQRLVTGISAGVALLGAVGLATGLTIHNHFKKKQ